MREIQHFPSQLREIQFPGLKKVVGKFTLTSCQLGAWSVPYQHTPRGLQKLEKVKDLQERKKLKRKRSNNH